MGNNCSTKPRPINTQSSIPQDMNPAELSNYQTGKMYENRAEFQQAALYYTLAIRANPNSALSYCGLGNCQLKIGDYMRALDYYQTAIGQDPNCKFAYNGLGIIYQNVKNDKEAIKSFNKAIQIDPNFSYPYNGLGNLHYARKNYAEALTNYEIAGRLQPNNPIVLANIACSQMGLGKTQQAFSTFKKAQNSLNGTQTITPTNRLYLKAKLDQFSAAVQKSDVQHQQQFKKIKQAVL